MRTLTSASDKKRNKAGISLAELTIVLGVVGIMFGGIWVLARSQWETIRRNESVRQILTVAVNTQALYQGQVGIDINDNYVNLTNKLLHQGAIPLDMCRKDDDGACTWIADHTWGQKAADGTLLNNGGFAVGIDGSDTQAFGIQLRGLKRDNCITLAMRVSSAALSSGLTSITINTPVKITALPVDVVAADNSCNAISNDITFIFRLRRKNQ